MAKSSSRSSFLVGIYIVTVCFFGSSKAQSGYGGPRASVYKIGGSPANDGLSANPNSDMNNRPGFDGDASGYEGTRIGGGQQYEWTNGYQSFDNFANRRNSDYMRNPNYYYPIDTFYDDEMQNIRNPSSDNLLPVRGEGSANWNTYESQDSYYDSSQQMDCGNYDNQYERDLCQRNKGARGSTINGIDSYQSTGGSSRGSLSGLSQSSNTGESSSNRMVSSNQASRGGSNERNRDRLIRPAYGSQFQSSATRGLSASSQSSSASSSQFEYNDSSQVRSEGFNGGNLGGSPRRPSGYRYQPSQTGQRRENIDRPSPSYGTGPSRPAQTASSQVSRTDSSQLNNKGSSQASSTGSGGRNVSRPSQSSSSSSNSYQTGPSRPAQTASSQVSRTDSSQLNNKGSSQASSTVSGGRNVSRPSQSSSSSSNSYQTGPSRPVPTASSQVSHTDSSRSNNKGSSQASSTGSGGRNVGRPSQSSSSSSNSYQTGPSRPVSTGSSQVSHTDSSRFSNQGSSQPSSKGSGTIPSELALNFGPTNPDSNGLMVSFTGQLKILHGQFNEIIVRLLRYLDQVSHRGTAQVPVENQPAGFVPIMDDGTTSVVQLNWSPTSALEQLYRRANGVIGICNEYLTHNGVDLSRGGEYEASQDLKSLLSSLYHTGVSIIQEIGSNTGSALQPLPAQYQSDWNANLRNFMISLRNMGRLFDGYINKVITTMPTSYSQETINPQPYGHH